MIKNALKASFLFGVSEIIQKGGVFLLIPFLTQILLPSDYGLISSVLILVASTTVILSFSFHGVITRYYHTYKGPMKKVFISTVLTSLLIFNSLFFVLIYIFRFKLNEYYFSNELSDELLLVVILLIMTQPFFIFGNAYFKIGVKLNLFLLYFNLYYIMQFLGLVIFVINYKLSVPAYLYTLLFSNLLYFFSFCIYFYYKNGFYLELRFTKRILKYMLLVLPVDLLSVTSVFLDRYFIVLFLGFTAVGVYYVAYQLSIITQIVALAINSAIMPYFYKALKRNLDQFYSRFYEVYIPFVGLVCFILILFSESIVRYTLSEEYSEVAEILPILFLSTFFIPMYLLLTNILTISTKLQSRKLQAAILLLIFNLGSTYFLVVNYGLLGAALSTLIVNMLSVFLFFSIIRTYKVISLNLTLFFEVFLILLGLTALVLFNTELLYLMVYTLLSALYCLNFIFKGMKKKIKNMEIEFASFK